jgi:hypothetical protein
VDAVVVGDENPHGRAMRLVRPRDNHLRLPRNDPQLNSQFVRQFLLREAGLTMSALGRSTDPS